MLTSQFWVRADCCVFWQTHKQYGDMVCFVLFFIFEFEYSASIVSALDGNYPSVKLCELSLYNGAHLLLPLHFFYASLVFRFSLRAAFAFSNPRQAQNWVVFFFYTTLMTRVGETKSWETRRPSGRRASHRHRPHSKQVSWLAPDKLGSSKIRTQVGATSLFT